VARTETTIQSEILLAVGGDPRFRVWRQNTGVGRALTGGAIVRFGVRGGADLSGLIVGTGQRLEIEVKTDRGKQSKAQVRFGNMINECGGLYIVARSDVDALAQLDAYLRSHDA